MKKQRHPCRRSLVSTKYVVSGLLTAALAFSVSPAVAQRRASRAPAPSSGSAAALERRCAPIENQIAVLVNGVQYWNNNLYDLKQTKNPDPDKILFIQSNINRFQQQAADQQKQFRQAGCDNISRHSVGTVKLLWTISPGPHQGGEPDHRHTLTGQCSAELRFHPDGTADLIEEYSREEEARDTDKYGTTNAWSLKEQGKYTGTIVSAAEINFTNSPEVLYDYFVNYGIPPKVMPVTGELRNLVNATEPQKINRRDSCWGMYSPSQPRGNIATPRPASVSDSASEPRDSSEEHVIINTRWQLSVP